MIKAIKFTYQAPEEPENIVFNTVFAEKEGGGAVDVSDFPPVKLPAGLVVGWSDELSLYRPIKQFRLMKAVTASDTTIEIQKNSGLKGNEFIAFAAKSVQAAGIDTSNPDKDVVTVSFETAIPAGKVGYVAKSASSSGAEPEYKPEYLTGNSMPGGEVNTLVRLVNGANVRKDNVMIADEILAQLKTINTER